MATEIIPVASPVVGYEAQIVHCFNPRNPAQGDYQAVATRLADGKQAKGAYHARRELAQAALDAFFADLIVELAAAADLEAEIAAYADELAQAADVSANTPPAPASPIPHLVNTPTDALQATLAVIFDQWQRAVLAQDQARVADLAARGRAVAGAWKGRCQEEQRQAA
jgi:hypothetical protein